MTDLNDLLTHVRNHYVDMFEAALEELRGKGHTLIVEPPVVDEAGQLIAGVEDFVQTRGGIHASPFRCVGGDGVDNLLRHIATLAQDTHDDVRVLLRVRFPIGIL